MLGKRGLTAVKSSDLKLILKAVHRKELACPISQVGLATVGLLRLGDDLDTLRGLDEAGVRAVIVAVLAERG
jgi:hypothetical protein